MMMVMMVDSRSRVQPLWWKHRLSVTKTKRSHRKRIRTGLIATEVSRWICPHSFDQNGEGTRCYRVDTETRFLNHWGRSLLRQSHQSFLQLNKKVESDFDWDIDPPLKKCTHHSPARFSYKHASYRNFGQVKFIYLSSITISWRMWEIDEKLKNLKEKSVNLHDRDKVNYCVFQSLSCWLRALIFI